MVAKHTFLLNDENARRRSASPFSVLKQMLLDHRAIITGYVHIEVTKNAIQITTVTTIEQCHPLTIPAQACALLAPHPSVLDAFCPKLDRLVQRIGNDSLQEHQQTQRRHGTYISQ